MLWSYRVCRDRSGRYSIREVFYEHDGRLISYGKHPVAPTSTPRPTLPLAAVIAQLAQTPDPSSDLTPANPPIP